jgi:hypothetical protein
MERAVFHYVVLRGPQNKRLGGWTLISQFYSIATLVFLSFTENRSEKDTRINRFLQYRGACTVLILNILGSEEKCLALSTSLDHGSLSFGRDCTLSSRLRPFVLGVEGCIEDRVSTEHSQWHWDVLAKCTNEMSEVFVSVCVLLQLLRQLWLQVEVGVLSCVA